MRRFAACCLLLWAGSGLCQSSHPVTMWLAEGAGNRVYILGSVHLLRPEDHPLPAVIDAAYDDAEALVMELDMDDLDPARMQASVIRLGMIQDDRTLRDLMGEARYAEAAGAAEALEIPLDMLEKTEPWYAAITVEQLILARIGFNPLYGVEMHLMMKASADGKPISGLETVDEQLGFLDSLPLDAQVDLLITTLVDGREIRETMDALIEAWRHGDTALLESEMLADMEDHEALYEAIVVERNRRWVETIETLLDDQSDYLVIVGALHLIGDDGVPMLLRERGIEIGQMQNRTEE